MRLTKSEIIYAVCGAVSIVIVTLLSHGIPQKYFGVGSVEVLFFIAMILGSLALQHGFLLALVALYRERVQPVAWLLTRSRHAIPAILNLTACVIFTIGVALGFALSSKTLLIVTLVASLTIIFATAWTFRGHMGPLAAFLEERLNLELDRHR